MTKHKFINLCLMPMHNTPEMNLETVLVFGPESVSYERPRRETTAKLYHFSERAFFQIMPPQF